MNSTPSWEELRKEVKNEIHTSALSYLLKAASAYTSHILYV